MGGDGLKRACLVDIKRMTKNPNPGFFFNFHFFVRSEGKDMAGQGKMRCWQGSGNNYFHR